MSTLPPPTEPSVVPRPVTGPARYEAAPHGWGPPVTTLDPPSPPHPTLPLAAGLGAIVVLTASLLVSKIVLDWLVRFEWPLVGYVVILGVIGYGPSLVWCRYASQRWGSGHLRADVGLLPRWSDLGWGPVVWLCAIGSQIVVGALVVAFDIPLQNNTDGIAELAADRTYVVALVLTAVVAAPVVEEIVFRGVVLRSLLGRLPAGVAVGVQAVVFGAAHVDPVRGAGNIGLVVVLSAVGAALGGAAFLLRRIGPTIVAHAILNGVVMVLVLTGVTDRLGS